MTTADGPSALEHEIEEAREQLATTIDQLLYRANPKTIANRQLAAVKAKFVDEETGEPRTDNILKVAGTVAGVITVIVVLRTLSRR